MNDDTERLISRYLDGAATPDEIARLDGLLRQDPEVRRALFLAAEQGDALRELFSEGRNAALARKAELAPARRAWLIASAAALAIAFVGSVILGLSGEPPRPAAETPLAAQPVPPVAPVPAPSPVVPKPEAPAVEPEAPPAPAPQAPAPPTPAPVPPPLTPVPPPAPAPAAPPVARDTVVTVGVVEKVGGDVRIRSGDRVVPASAGLKLLSGQGVETLGRGRAVLSLDKGLTLEIGDDTLVSGVVGADVVLEKGSVQGDLPAARSRESVVVATRRARAEVGGTKFTIRSSPDGTWLGVDRGRGRLQRKEDGATIEISAGQFGAVMPGAPFAPRAQEVAVDQVRVDEAISKGVEFLRTVKETGTVMEKSEELLLLTLLHAGVTESDPQFKKLLSGMLEAPLDKTYNVSLQAMILEELDRAKYQHRLQLCAQFLVDNQCKNGQWSYGTPTPFVDSLPVPTEAPKPVQTGGARDFSAAKEKPKITRKLPVKKMREGPPTGDNSNSQYAALGLRACFDGGIELPRAVVQLAKDWWIKSQAPDEAPNSGYEGVRGWNYGKPGKKDDDDDINSDVLGSMTAGAVGSLVICDYILGLDWKKNLNARAGLNWLASHFTVTDNPGGKPWRQYYYLYGLERAGILSGTEKLGAHAWYPLGARYLIEQQQANGSWKLQHNRTNPLWDTCFAILFLKKATKPLVASEDRKRK